MLAPSRRWLGVLLCVVYTNLCCVCWANGGGVPIKVLHPEEHPPFLRSMNIGPCLRINDSVQRMGVSIPIRVTCS